MSVLAEIAAFIGAAGGLPGIAVGIEKVLKWGKWPRPPRLRAISASLSLVAGLLAVLLAGTLLIVIARTTGDVDGVTTTRLRWSVVLLFPGATILGLTGLYRGLTLKEPSLAFRAATGLVASVGALTSVLIATS